MSYDIYYIRKQFDLILKSLFQITVLLVSIIIYVCIIISIIIEYLIIYHNFFLVFFIYLKLPFSFTKKILNKYNNLFIYYYL